MEVNSNECFSCYKALQSKGLGVVPGPAVLPPRADGRTAKMVRRELKMNIEHPYFSCGIRGIVGETRGFHTTYRLIFT